MLPDPMASTAIKKPDSVQVRDVLGVNYIYAIPDFQREFAWKTEEVEELITDIINSSDEGVPVFLGTIILQAPRDNKIDIVDGQQRITTILFILIALRQLFKEKGQGLHFDTANRYIVFQHETREEIKGQKLIAAANIRLIFDMMSDRNWDGVFPDKTPDGQKVKREANRVKDAYKKIYNTLKDCERDTLVRILESVLAAYFIKFEVPDVADAVAIFERTNARGKDLEVADLLKSYLFQMHFKDEVKNLPARWKKITGSAKTGFLRMLKYFSVSTEGPVSKRDLYKKLSRRCESVGTECFLSELESFSDYYNLVRGEQSDDGDYKDNKSDFAVFLKNQGYGSIYEEDDKFERFYFALQAFRVFKIMQVYPLVYAAMLAYKRALKAKPEKMRKYAESFIRLVEALEKYHFVNTAICGRMGNQVEQLYADKCKEFDTNPDFQGVVEGIVVSLRSKLAPFSSEFEGKFCALSFSNTNPELNKTSRALIHYIFDRFNNNGLRPVDATKIFSLPKPGKTKTDRNVEHFYPESPPSGEVRSVSLEDACSIGNLFSLGRFLNADLGNSLPVKKVELMRGKYKKKIQTLSYVQEFLDEYGDKEWTGELIRARAKKLANDGYYNVWLIK